MSVTLFLSVGGSVAPLKTSLRLTRPDKAIFVVSDGRDGSESSASQIPDLRAAEGCPPEGAMRCLKVPADDPDRALALIEPYIEAELASGAEVILDYTGGTKSMTSALVLAAAAHEGASLRFMLGRREGLIGVADGTEQPTTIPKALIGLAQSFATLKSFVAARNYAAARALIETTARDLQNTRGIKPPGQWSKRIDRWRRWLEIMDLWDRFDHAAAWRKVEYALDNGHDLADFDGTSLSRRLKTLAEADDRPTPALLEDLWLNALRRAELGLYDDAVQRLYRLAEASVQTRLWVHHKVMTADVEWDSLSPGLQQKVKRQYDRKLRRDVTQLSLSDALDHLRYLDSEDALIKQWERNPQWQGNRNHSILAHGFKPIGKETWEEAYKWFAQRRGPFWEELLGRATAEQLPNRLPDKVPD